MSRRERPYVSRPSEALRERLLEAAEARLFVVQAPGVTSFILKAETSERKHRVSIGSVHTCTCGARDQPCLHVAFVLLRVFRLSPDDARCWQSSLIDLELEALVEARARAAATNRGHAIVKPPSERRPGEVARRAIEGEEAEPCPICYEELDAEEEPAGLLDWCKRGCGKSVHRRCLKIWSDHQTSIGKALSCPFCRTDWSAALLPVPPPAAAARRAVSMPVHHQARCRSCHQVPIHGTRYRCLSCSTERVELCHNCFESGMHPNHPFAARVRPTVPWVTAAYREMVPSAAASAITPTVAVQSHGASLGPTPSSVGGPLARAEAVPATHAPTSSARARLLEIQHREITPEDYELLLNLTEEVAASPTPPPLPPPTLHSLPPTSLDTVTSIDAAEIESLVAALNAKEAAVARRRAEAKESAAERAQGRAVGGAGFGTALLRPWQLQVASNAQSAGVGRGALAVDFVRRPEASPETVAASSLSLGLAGNALFPIARSADEPTQGGQTRGRSVARGSMAGTAASDRVSLAAHGRRALQTGTLARGATGRAITDSCGSANCGSRDGAIFTTGSACRNRSLSASRQPRSRGGLGGGASVATGAAHVAATTTAAAHSNARLAAAMLTSAILHH